MAGMTRVGSFTFTSCQTLILEFNYSLCPVQFPIVVYNVQTVRICTCNLGVYTRLALSVLDFL